MSLTVAEESELIALLEAEERFLASEDYYAYVKYTHGSMYQYTRHGEHIANVLGDAVRRRQLMKAGELPLEDQYIMVNVPPQHGKSMHITETFPSFFLGKFPDEGCIEVSYNDRFAEKFGGKNKDKIKEHGENLFGIRISTDTNAKGEWEVTDAAGRKTRGGMISRGIMSGITGSSLGDCIIIDDPLKNREEANSQTIRDKHWDEWVDSIATRIHPGAIVVIIMTRWHEDDLCGRLLNPEYGPVLPWLRVNLPLEADEKHLQEEGNPLGRQLGEPLWPERYGPEFVERRKAFASSFNALYQGRPSSQEGNLLKRQWWKYYDTLPPTASQLISVDAAFKDEADSDFVVIQVWGKVNADMYLIDQVRARMNFPATVKTLENMVVKHPDAVLKLVEDKANGSAIISTLRQRMGGIVAVNPEGGKVARVNAVSAYIESGNTYLPRQADWIHDFVEECAAFPKGTHDDQVDAMSQALHRFIYHRGELPAPPPKPTPFPFQTEENSSGGFMEW
ncbi:phage terminase large subunit [Paenibacillus humicus]|uniref:phage terminase large subunit n=1 Tax=Paenibacillus humicus TaxID=412861 RepID=UPI003F188FB2